MTEIITTYLQMNAPSELRPRPSHDPKFSICEVERGRWQLSRSLYLEVGAPWQWTDKRNWSDEQWRAYVADELRTFVGKYDDEIAGYFELQRDAHQVEIAYFGLMPGFIGRGLGGALLTSAIEQAWQWNAARVWVHTCTLDHPAALRNYQARGMHIYKTVTHRA